MKFNKIIGLLFARLEKNISQIMNKLFADRYLVIFLVLIAIISYGFELFNLNLTIDEEVASFLPNANIAWISQGRWGMYLLNKYLFPYTIIPFVPLFIALLFQLGAILLLLKSFDIDDKLTQFIIGAIGISYPGLAYVYTFSTFNYGVGIGLFFVALSLFIYRYNSGFRKFWAVVPGAFAISIYQGFVPALISVFLLHIIYGWEKPNNNKIKTLINVTIINLFSTAIYFLFQKCFHFITSAPDNGYINQYFDFNYLRENFFSVLEQLLKTIFRVYSGDKVIYGIGLPGFGILLIVLAMGILFNILRLRTKVINKIVLIIFTLVFLMVPFLSGLLTRGYLAMRFLVGLPIVISGWVILGLNNHSILYKYFIAIITLITVFQFVSSSNYLFASSSLALEQDRLLGSRLLERIEFAKADAGSTNIKYLEIVGFLDKKSSILIPELETFGASFFEWDQGNVWRVKYFFQTLGYYDLEPLPNDQRVKLIPFTNKMPNWPDIGSTQVVDDIVIIKFSSYSENQKLLICRLNENQLQLKELNFCH